MKITLFGSRGFVGRHLRNLFEAEGHDVFCPSRDDWPSGEDLGTVVYSIGLTADFRERPTECFDAHVFLPQRVLRENRCQQFVYLSSTRVYGSRFDYETSLDAAKTHSESDPVLVQAGELDDAYNISKLAGESLVLMHDPGHIVVRLSNVVGEAALMQSFLGQVVKQIKDDGKLTLQSHPDAAKDYVSISAVGAAVLGLLGPVEGGIYNVCNGYNISHRQWLTHLLGLLDFEWEGSSSKLPPEAGILDNRRLCEATGFVPEDVQTVFDALIV